MQVVKIEEQRQRPRVETKVTVRVGKIRKTYHGNLSKSGIFLETSQPFAKVGEELRLEMLLPNATDPVRVIGKVVRVAGPQKVSVTPGIGIQFLKVETRSVRTFDRLMDRLVEARGLGSRKHPRVKAQLFVELKTKRDVQQAITENVSKGGIFLKLPAQTFNLGDSLHVVLSHPASKRKFETEAEVVHLRQGESNVRDDFVEGVGIEFANLSSGRKSEVSNFLRKLLSARKR